ncbi:hypothetical protein F4775DRAFT_554180 [Biscogniauxia sp. FL1348]|nr:hypothetical protein F4775DRAFT_554180 [Biscogniauxia sp. FL1348]
MRASAGILAAVLAAVPLATATPPACLLSALGLQGNPSDIKAVCGDLQSAVRGNLTNACSDDMLPTAYEVYSSKCLAAGVTVSSLSTSSTASATASSSGVASNSATATSDATSTSGDSTSGTSTASSSSSTATGAGAATEPQPFMFAVAALLATGLTSVILL